MYVFRIFLVSITGYRPKGGRQIPSKVPAKLLETCRQIYTEARMLPFAINTFHFDLPGIEFWIEKRPTQMKAVTTLKMPPFALDRQMQNLCLEHLTGLKRIIIRTDAVKMHERWRKIIEEVLPGIEIVLQR